MKSLTWVYASDWYDGPMSGKVRADDGKIYWAVLVDEVWNKEKGTSSRTYAIKEMPEDWWKLENEQHELWLACCGNYCLDKPEGWKQTRNTQEFYDKYKSDVRGSHENIGVVILVVNESFMTILKPWGT